MLPVFLPTVLIRKARIVHLHIMYFFCKHEVKIIKLFSEEAILTWTWSNYISAALLFRSSKPCQLKAHVGAT